MDPGSTQHGPASWWSTQREFPPIPPAEAGMVSWTRCHHPGLMMPRGQEEGLACPGRTTARHPGRSSESTVDHLDLPLEAAKALGSPPLRGRMETLGQCGPQSLLASGSPGSLVAPESNINPDFCIFKTRLRCFRIWVHLAIADPGVCLAVCSTLGHKKLQVAFYLRPGNLSLI